MPSTKFHRPVVVQLGRIDRDLVVQSVEQAAELLLHFWRTDGPERRKALDACRVVIDKGHAPYVARSAFVKAAKAAKVLVSEDGTPNPNTPE